MSRRDARGTWSAITAGSPSAGRRAFASSAGSARPRPTVASAGRASRRTPPPAGPGTQGCGPPAWRAATPRRRASPSADAGSARSPSAARRRLQPGDDAAFPVPRAGGVIEAGEAPHPVSPGLGAAHLDVVADITGQVVQRRVAGQPEDVVDAVRLAPRHGPGPPVPALRLPQENQPAVRGNQATGEIGGHLLAAYGWQFERQGSAFGHGGCGAPVAREENRSATNFYPSSTGYAMPAIIFARHHE